MNASMLLTDLIHRGVRLSASGENLNIDAPKGAITSDLRAALVEHKTSLIRLLNSEEADVQWRVEAMRLQYVPGRGGFPFFVARRDFVDAPGCCLSCGEPHGPGRKYRCSPCVRAVEIVINEVLEGRPRDVEELPQEAHHDN